MSLVLNRNYTALVVWVLVREREGITDEEVIHDAEVDDWLTV